MLPSVFQKGLGTLKGFKAKIYVDSDAVPRFHPARSVQRDRVDKELKRLQEEGTLEPVDISEWAAPIVAVLKSDKNSVRICGDFSVTINPVSKLDRYPIPKVEDLFSRLSGGKYFTKLDLSHAYQQVPLEENPRKTSWSTPIEVCFDTPGFRLASHPHQKFFNASLEVSFKESRVLSFTWMTFSSPELQKKSISRCWMRC